MSGLSVKWSKRECDLLYCHDNVQSADGHLLYVCFCCGQEGLSLVDELKKRGYDLTTLRFSVKKKDAPIDVAKGK
jgi:hypothetical protein